MTNFSITKNYISLKKYHIKLLPFGCSGLYKSFILFIICFSSLTILAQTKEAETPPLPDWVQDIIYLNPSATVAGDGTWENPARDLTEVSWIPTWSWSNVLAFGRDSNYGLRNPQNIAILFKGGSTHDIQGEHIRIRSSDSDGQYSCADNMYIGSYGQGKAKLINVRQFETQSNFQIVENLELQGRLQDTTYLTENFRGVPQSYCLQDPKQTELHMNNVDITYGYRAIALTRYARVEIDSMYMTDIWHDGIFANNVDSMFINNWHIERFNKEWAWPLAEPHNGYHEGGPGTVPGGDALQLNGGNTYTEVTNSLIDGSTYGGKFNVIGENDSGIKVFKNCTFIAHVYKVHFHASGGQFYIHNSVFLGPGSMGQSWNVNLYNSVVIGIDRTNYFKDPIDTWRGRQGYLFMNVQNGEFYNNVFVEHHNIIEDVNTNPAFRNNIFYNVTDPYTGIWPNVDGSGNIHWNTDETTQDISKYSNPSDGSSFNNRTNVEPVFVNPTVSYTYNTDDNRTYGGNPREGIHHYYEWESWGDWRLVAGSPGIDEGDPDVYDPNATYIANVHGTSDGSTRYYAGKQLITHDKDSVARPQGTGYDIGAYEYTGETGHTLIFQIENESGSTINNARITFNGVSRPQDMYTLHGIAEGNYDYSVSAPGYENYVYTGLLVEGNMEITVVMTELPTYNLIFDVKDDRDNLIGNTTITFGTITNPAGNYNFSGIAPGSYNYSLDTPGYQAVNVNNYQVDGDATIPVVMSLNNYQISLSASPSAGGSVSGQDIYQHGQTVNISAQANNGYNFVNWTENGNSISTEPDYTFTATQNRNLVANFSGETYSVSLTENPTGAGTLSGAGNYNHNDNVTVSAQANTGYTFINWTENGSVVSTNPQFSFTLSQNREFTAHFSINSYAVTAASNPVNGGGVSGPDTFYHGQTASLQATPAEDYNFVNWTENGSVVSHNPQYSFTVTQGRNLTANFALEVFMVTLESNPADAAILNGAGNYNPGDNVTINSEPNPGYVFQNWTDGELLVSQNPQFSFEITSDRNLTANFSEEVYSLTLNPNPSYGGITTGAGNYPHGENVTVDAIPNPGFQFVSWTQNGFVVSEESIYTFQITHDSELMAQFAPNEYLVQVLVSPDEAGSGSVTGAGWYEHGQAVSLEALPLGDYRFLHWTTNDSVVSTNPLYTFIATKNIDLVAVFLHTDELVKIDATSFPPGYAFIEGGGDYPMNRTVSLKATPMDNDFSFEGWMENGEYIGSENPFLFNATEDRQITASFIYEPGELEVNAQLSIPETGYIYGVGNYSRGQTAILQVELNENVSFLGWKNQAGQIVSRQNPYNLEVNRSLDMTAIVELKNNLLTDDDFHLKVHPNPSDGRFFVNLQEDAVMIVHNSQGVALENIKLTAPDMQINMGYLPPGVYFLIFKTTEEVYSTKIIIK